jgi:hypothetical protein
LLTPFTRPPPHALISPQLDKSFGFDTAVEQAQLPLLAAKTEASSALRGIGLVKVRPGWPPNLVLFHEGPARTCETYSWWAGGPGTAAC